MVGAGEERKQALGQRPDIVGPFAQGRDKNRDDIETVEQILPESALFDGRFQVDIRRGDDADVGLACSAVADTFVLAVLDESEELRLEGQGEISDFVQEQRPAVADGRPAGVVPDRPRERAFDMSEQFATHRSSGEKLGQEMTPIGLSARALQE